MLRYVADDPDPDPVMQGIQRIDTNKSTEQRMGGDTKNKRICHL